MSDKPVNSFLNGNLASIYAQTAIPIILVMGLNGLLAVVDALFLGHYVGPEALAAVTLMFPIYMLIVAVSTLVSSGTSSLLARHLGGNRLTEAREVFAGAHGLALLLGGVPIGLYWLWGPQLALLAAGGSRDLAQMGLTYLQITVWGAPVLFVLSVNADTLRNEGRVGLMAVMSVLVSFANIGFNYVLIARLDMGVAGSAIGTVMAQMLGLGVILVFRFRGATELRPHALVQYGLGRSWRKILALGAPQSLSFIGVALGSAATMMALQLTGGPDYHIIVSAYGIITRVMTFAFLPLLGLSFAMQSITGNCYGAGKWQRSDSSLSVAIVIAFAYCACVQLALTVFAAPIGRAFVANTSVVAEIVRILPVMVALYVLSGPVMMIAGHFQAIGDAGLAALLSLSKPYLFAIPLTFVLGSTLGERGIWYAGPLAEGMLFLLTAVLLTKIARQQGRSWGLFQGSGQVRL